MNEAMHYYKEQEVDGNIQEKDNGEGYIHIITQKEISQNENHDKSKNGDQSLMH